jgi:hypothetical protein
MYLIVDRAPEEAADDKTLKDEDDDDIRNLHATKRRIL